MDGKKSKNVAKNESFYSNAFCLISMPILREQGSRTVVPSKLKDSMTNLSKEGGNDVIVIHEAKRKGSKNYKKRPPRN